MIFGQIADGRRPTISASVHSSIKAAGEAFDLWIDTGFDGHLLLPNSDIQRLGLDELGLGNVILADGLTVELVSYYGMVQWFGEWLALQVIASDNGSRLLGTALLADCEVTLNFSTGTVEITKVG